MTQAYFSSWRVGVCGASHGLPDVGRRTCEALGEKLGALASVKIVHMGLKHRADAPPADFAASWHFIEGAKRTLAGPASRRIETIVAGPNTAEGATAMTRRMPQHADPPAGNELFIEGVANQVKAGNRQARRFHFVNSLDAIVGVGGGTATREQLTLASAIELPMVPVPFVKGTAATFWAENRDRLASDLQLDTAMLERWERPPVNEAEIQAITSEMVTRLVQRLPRRCFVIMPYDPRYDTLYDLVIEPALASMGCEIVRLDRLHRPGTVIQQIEEGIRTADFCIVVLDGFRPNVLYEMGYAQALGKPLVLVLQNGQLESPDDVPFDISTLQRIDYERPDRNTLARLKLALAHVARPR